MIKVVALCLLVLVALSMTVDFAHEQGFPTNSGHSSGHSSGSNQLKPGFRPTAGDPFGNNRGQIWTCFRAPCIAPPGRCNNNRGCWKPVILRVPTSNGHGRFVGFQCARC